MPSQTAQPIDVEIDASDPLRAAFSAIEISTGIIATVDRAFGEVEGTRFAQCLVAALSGVLRERMGTDEARRFVAQAAGEGEGVAMTLAPASRHH